MKISLLTYVVTIFILASAVFAQEEKSFTYKKAKEGDLSINAFFPADWKADQQRPAIVFFFGGGWANGTPKQFESQAKYLAERGMVALCADYRVKSRHGVKPDACVEDAKSAIRWVRQNAAMLGVDPDRIVGSGGSAGGHIAACTGLCPGLDATDEDQNVSSKPNVLVLFNPVLNFNVPLLTDRIDGDEKLARAISPTQHLAKDSPPTLILYGTDDRLLAQGKEFMKQSKELGHRSEMLLAEGVGHGFFNRQPWLDRTTKRMDEFLVSLGYLNPTIRKQD